MESTLAGLVSSVLLFSSVRADEVRVEFEDTQVQPGQTSSYVIRIDAGNLPEQVLGITYVGNTLPSAIQSIDNYDAFHNNNQFTSGFWNGENVGAVVIHNNDGAIAMNPTSLPGPIGNNSLAVRYFFTVNPNATPGVYTHSLNSTTTKLNIYNGSGAPFDYFPPLTSGTFTVVAPQIPSDINGDGVRDMTDVQLFTNVLLGTETNPAYVTNSDMNGDTLTNGEDVQPFVDAFLAP